LAAADPVQFQSLAAQVTRSVGNGKLSQGVERGDCAGLEVVAVPAGEVATVFVGIALACIALGFAGARTPSMTADPAMTPIPAIATANAATLFIACLHFGNHAMISAAGHPFDSAAAVMELRERKSRSTARPMRSMSIR
jgi:hypothetical protein